MIFTLDIEQAARRVRQWLTSGAVAHQTAGRGLKRGWRRKERDDGSPNYENTDLPELYTALMAMDELIAQHARFGIDDPRHHNRRTEIAEVVERRFPDVPVEAFATAEGPPVRPFGMVNPPPPAKLYARVAYGSVLDYRKSPMMRSLGSAGIALRKALSYCP